MRRCKQIDFGGLKRRVFGFYGLEYSTTATKNLNVSGQCIL